MTELEKKYEELIEYYEKPKEDQYRATISFIKSEIADLKQQGEIEQEAPVSAERLKIIAVLNSIIPMAEDALKGYKKSESSHQEFIREDEEDIKKAKEVVITLIKYTSQQGEKVKKELMKFLKQLDEETFYSDESVDIIIDNYLNPNL